MSGYKRATINITQDEYQRLRDAEIKLRALPDIPNPAYYQVSQQSEEVLKKNLADMEQRQAQFEAVIAGLNEHIAQLESATAQKMLAYKANATAEVQTYAGYLWDHTNQILAAQNDYFQNTITAAHEQYQDALENQSRQIRRMTSSLEQKRDLAQEWLGTAEQFCVFIQLNYAHDVLAPGRVAQLETRLEQAAENLNQGLFEAAVVSGQQLYSALSDLRVELEWLQSEWQLMHQTAWETTRQIIIQALDSLLVPAVDLDGDFLPFAVDVNYWSQGRLAKFIAEMELVQGRLEDSDQLPDRETLRGWLETGLPMYYQALSGIVLEARINALNSQLRINIADLVVRSLQEQGFSLFASDYEGADMRNTYAAVLKNLEGNEVVVEVVPTGQEVGENELHMQSYDREERTEHELQQRWYEVSRSLSFYGLAVGPYMREEAGEYVTRQPSRGSQADAALRGQTRQKSHRPGLMNGYRTHPTGLPEG